MKMRNFDLAMSWKNIYFTFYFIFYFS